MKERKYSKIFSLTMALTVLSPMVAADADPASSPERHQTDQRKPLKFKLKQDQMDKVTAGRWNSYLAQKTYMRNLQRYSECGNDFFCKAFYEDNMSILQDGSWIDDPGPIQCYTC